jgi:hypothetical protein
MAITHCTNPHAGEGYDPNTYSNSDEATAAHIAEAHVVSYVGCVLKLGEHNYHDDSDFFAWVWDEDKKAVIEVSTGTTRGWTYHDGGKVDATDDVKIKAIAWEADSLVKGWVRDAEEAAVKESTKINKGDEVRSLTTRGKNKGLVGTVRWIGRDDYQSFGETEVLRYGIAVEGEAKLRYLSEDKVELANGPRPVEEITDEDRHYYTNRALARARSMYQG